jgi:hypothetical protein
MASRSFSAVERQKIRPHIVGFFDRYPEAARQYGATGLFHLTHSMNVPGILEHGLDVNQAIFPPEQGQFLLDMFDRYGNRHPGERLFVSDRIIASHQVYVSTEVPNLGAYEAYGVPERLVYLMRGLHTLGDKQSLTSDERAYARAAFDQHYQRLTEGEPTITAINVDPFAPAVLNSRLGGIALDTFQDEEEARWFMEEPDRYSANIPLTDAVEPQHLEVYGTCPLPTDQVLDRVTQPANWASSIQ